MLFIRFRFLESRPYEPSHVVYIYVCVVLYCTCTGHCVCHSRLPVKPLQAWSSCTSHTPPEDGSQTSGVHRWHSLAAGSVEDRCTRLWLAHTDDCHSYMLERKRRNISHPSIHRSTTWLVILTSTVGEAVVSCGTLGTVSANHVGSALALSSEGLAGIALSAHLMTAAGHSAVIEERRQRHGGVTTERRRCGRAEKREEMLRWQAL